MSERRASVGAMSEYQIAAAPVQARALTLRRIITPVSTVALAILALTTVAAAFATVAAGWMAQQPQSNTLWVLGACVIGAAVFNTVGHLMWAGVVDRAEGRLRSDLLTAALDQPLADLTATAVGEVLDRVDDDTRAVGFLTRRQLWGIAGTAFGLVPMYVVAGITWTPAWLVFPVLLGIAILVARPLLPVITKAKVAEEAAWTENAAAFEEAVAARDDLRTSLGQPFAVRRLAELSAAAHARLADVLKAETKMIRRVGVMLSALLGAVVIVGVALATADQMPLAQLVTLFLITSGFVGSVSNFINQLPDIQEGLGAVLRIRQMLDVAPEPVGGAAVPTGPLSLEVRGLNFRYAEGSFGLKDVNLTVPAGQTVALVGRTGSGKTTLASMLSRAVEPPPGAVFLGGVDVTSLDLTQLRATIGVVTQRTELVLGTLRENITLFGDPVPGLVEAAVDELGLTDWVASLPDGLETMLGPGGTKLSAGEEQLVAFARLLVRNVQVVVLDEATARMDPLTEARVVAAADRLLSGRTGVLVAHRLSTIERADLVAVLDAGAVAQFGPQTALSVEEGPFKELLRAGGVQVAQADRRPFGGVSNSVRTAPGDSGSGTSATAIGGQRRVGDPPPVRTPRKGPGFAITVLRETLVKPWWGIGGAIGFTLTNLFAAQGAITGFWWGRVVEGVSLGHDVRLLTGLMVSMLLITSFALAYAVRVYPHWWVEILFRVRMAVMRGQIQARRLPPTPPGEIVGRTMDGDRFVRYADRWIDFSNGLIIVAITAILGRSWQAGAVLLAVMVISALAATAGRRVAGRSVTRSSETRALFGRALVSCLDAARTLKLAARIPQAHAHLQKVDSGRIKAAIFEHRVQAVLDGVPIVMIQVGLVTAWWLHLAGQLTLPTTLMVASAVAGFGWFGIVAGAVVTEAPGTRAWLKAVTAYADGADLTRAPEGVDFFAGTAPAAALPEPGVGLTELTLRGFSARHDDGTIGVEGVDLTVKRGELVLLLGQVGSGKSSLLGALAGLIHYDGDLAWNGEVVADPETFLRPQRVALVSQVPRVMSGTFADNVRLDFADRSLEGPLEAARMVRDVDDAGGVDAMVGHRGVRLSGGQVQRLALARALATDSDLLLADDVSSALDASTEIELWDSLRARGTTVLGSTSKKAALARADRVVVLENGTIAASGLWRDLAEEWGHLAG